VNFISAASYDELDFHCRGNPMTLTKYRGYLICQQREFGPLRLLQWVEDGEFIVVKNNAPVLGLSSPFARV